MRKIIVTSIIITMLCTVALLNIISPLSESGSLTLLGGDVSEKEMTFKSAGADNSSIYLELNKEATVIESEMSITSSPHDGSYPKNVEVDVGGDGDAEWAFNGEGYGSFGHQTMFSNNQEYQNLIFKTGGYNADTYLKIPKDASITSANLKIKGFYGGETYVATVDYYGLVYYTQFHPDGTFDTPIKVDDVSSSQGRAGTGVADFDNDGDLDMIVGAGSSGANMKNIYYYEKIGTGATFAPKRVVGQVYANTHPYDFAIGDFNGDGNVDFMTEGYYDTSNKGYLYFGDGFGRFTTDNYAFNLYYPYGKSQGDLNGDGYVDIVIGGQPSSGGGYRLWWFENDGSGHSYTSHDMGLTNYPADYGVVVGDYDNDGYNDILTANWDAIWYFIKGQGNGNFNTRISLNIDTGSGPGFGDAFDFNYDGKLDLICYSDYYSGNIVWYEGNGDGTLKTSANSIGNVGQYGLGVATPTFGDLGNVKNPKLDVGDDNSIDWTKSGEFSDTDDFNFKTILDGLLNNPPAHIAQSLIKDEYGNEFYMIPFNFTSDSSGYIGLEVDVKYDYTAKIDIKPGGNLTTELNQYMKSVDTTGITTDITVPVGVMTEAPGKLKIADVDILYNLPPEPIKPILTITIKEDTVNDKLLDLNKYFTDPDLPLDKLTYTINSNSEEDNLDVHTDYDGWLQVGIKKKHWYGRAEIVVRATDKYGEYALSNEFIIKSESVEDNPDINEDRPLPDITIYEGGIDDSIDLDEMNYFYDPEGDPLYFVTEIDPLDVYAGEDISVSVSSKNELVVKGLGDWYGTDVPVWIYCDDDKEVKTLEDGNYVHQEILVHVLPVNDPPYWTEIPEVKIDEDSWPEKFTSVLNLSHYAFDIDNDPADLTYELQYNSNDDITIKLRQNNSIDVEVEPDFSGTGTVGVRVYDNESFADTTFKVNILPVNDPPSITIDSHEDFDVVSGLTTLFGTVTDAENDLQYVRIRIGDTGNWQYLTNDFDTWRYKWDTAKWGNGVYLITAEVYDGEYVDYTTVELTVSLSTNIKPTVDILVPKDGSTVDKTIKINGTASDKDGIVQIVQIRIDNVGSWLDCEGTDTWEFSLNTRSLSKGQHSIVARSYDGWDYSAIDSITINVDQDKKEDDDDDDDPIDVLSGEGGEAAFMSFILIIIIIIIVLAVIAFVVMKAREQRRAEAEVKALAEAEETAKKDEDAKKSAEDEDKGIDYQKYKFATPLALPAFMSEEDEARD